MRGHSVCCGAPCYSVSRWRPSRTGRRRLVRAGSRRWACRLPRADVEHYNSFNGSLGVSVPLYHVGGRGEAGFDIVWNAQPNWVANYNGGTSPYIAVEPFPSVNIASPGPSAFGIGGPGNVYIRTGPSWANCGGAIYYPSSTLTSLVFVTAS
jgi:hypothetical protein